MSNDDALLTLTAQGLYCAAGDFYIDPWPAPGTVLGQAVITHGHGDHARGGSARYLATAATAAVMRVRLGEQTPMEACDYHDERRLGSARVSLHPAGHVLGSAQVRVEVDNETWVVSGDFKRDPDPTCDAFEVVGCSTFITEATFALPIYRWRPGPEVAAEIAAWWRGNAGQGKASVLFCYAFGKAQRVMAELADWLDRPVLLHGAMLRLTDLYRELGVALPPTLPVSEFAGDGFAGELIIAPPSAAGSPWMRRFGRHATGFVSGWMRLRGVRRRRGYDRGFVMSDHADWPGLVRTVEETGAQQVLATHGRTDVLVRYLRERGIPAAALRTPYGDEDDG